ncbi:MAG: hypothetical protein QOJ25_2238 [Solirubrobacteraceae bacterium]|jgi:hypothetical protein|nr:hypothetical protein [Solirubrobacteraceae bacterium]
MGTERSRLSAPAFYALSGGGWRDLVTLLHPPYTAWHLSYVALGAVAATTLDGGRLLATLAAFFLAVGISAHALDELRGRPLQTTLPRGTLIALAVVGLAGAVGIGVAGAITISPLLAPLVVLGALLVLAYNLELAGGRFHSDLWFALAWGGFPAFTGYFAQTLTIRPAGVLVAAGCCLLSAAQRRLSTPVRELRRRTTAVSGEQRFSDGTATELTKARLAAPLEGALSALSIAVVLLAAGLVAVKL